MALLIPLHNSGGKAESIHSRQGQSVIESADDQSINDKSVRALLTNYRESRPLVLLVDDKYALFPVDLGASDITYAVLGFYTIAHFWGRYRSDSHYSIAPSQMGNFKRNINQPVMSGAASFGTSSRSSGVMARWMSCICLWACIDQL